ncbi:hypothetical protein AURDEDRAFT_185248, partial [Auricularia subglabra TFB-10046 SS5]
MRAPSATSRAVASRTSTLPTATATRIHTLPDELLREILWPSLVVDDALFADTRTKSPFSETEVSAAHVLLVCKRWMRLCTPWLYETVVIRSKAQALALNKALSRNPSFGAYIKKLRIEGGYDMSALVGIAPNVTDLCFSIWVWSNENANGLAAVLESVNPRRVLLTLFQSVENAKFEQLQSTLCVMLDRWTTLETFVFPYPGMLARSWELITGAIALRGHPTTVIFPKCQPEAFVLNHMAEHLAISRIIIPGVDEFDGDGRWRNSLPPRIGTIIRDTEKLRQEITAATRSQTDGNMISINPSYKPLQSASHEVRKRILREIISYACQGPTHNLRRTCPKNRFSWADMAILDAGVARRLCKVSVRFQYLAMEAMSEHVHLSSHEALAEFQAVLDEYPACGLRVKTLTAKPYLALASTLALCTGIERLTIESDHRNWWGGDRRDFNGPWTSRPILRTISQNFGTSLLHLDLGLCNGKIIEAGVFNALTALRTLSWYKGFEIEHGEPAVAVIMPQLTTLHFGTQSADKFNDAVSEFDLPNISEMHYSPRCSDHTAFLRRHGGKLRTVVVRSDFDEDLLGLVPNLEFLTLHSEEANSRAFAHQNHDSLHAVELGWRTDRCHIPQWKQLVQALTASASEPGRRASRTTKDRPAYPALRTVKATGLWEWPANEREISKSPWPAIAEGLLKHGIS